MSPETKINMKSILTTCLYKMEYIRHVMETIDNMDHTGIKVKVCAKQVSLSINDCHERIVELKQAIANSTD
jgi:hypothetical protein